AIGLQQYRGSQIALAVPPVAWTGGRTAEAQNAFPEAVELLALFDRLRTLAVGRRRARGLQPGADRLVLRNDMGQIGHQVLYDRHVRQRVDPHRAFYIL